MAFDIWMRATAKWRGIVTYALLQAAMRFVTSYIFVAAESPGLKLYASLAGLFTSIFCLTQTWLLLTRDRPGDEGWPPLWA
jgi:hypothetical protein